MADEQKPQHVLRAETGRFRVSGMSATMRTRQNFAALHLVSAATFSRRIGEIEQQNAGQPFGPFFDQMFIYAPPCVLSTVAGLESYANELFADREQNFTDTSSAIVDKLWELTEAKPLLDKFDVALTLLGKPPVPRGVRPAQDVAVLVRLRNAITHFKPEWFDEQAAHEDLSKLLRERFDGSPFLNPTERLFPRRWMTHAGTRWAVETAVSFITEFEKQAGLKPKLDGWGDCLKP